MSTDPKQGERDYYARIGAEGIAHSLAKPFGDDHAAQYLAELTALFSVMTPPPARVVEFGCGTGWLAVALAQRGYDVLGVDISADAVRHARDDAARRGVPQVRFETADYETFDAGAEPFDYALFHDSLHHAESELAALQCAYAALRPGGCVITFEPGSGHSRAAGSVHAVQEFHVHEKDMPPRHIVAVARQAGFRRHLVLPHPHQFNRLLYRRAYQRATSPTDLRGRRWLSVLRSLAHLLRWRTDPGMVLLWK
jgi:SAM-dependent methyltransferase